MRDYCACGRKKLATAVRCHSCEWAAEVDAFEERFEVTMLNNVETVEEMKDWIKRFLLGGG